MKALGNVFLQVKIRPALTMVQVVPLSQYRIARHFVAREGWTYERINHNIDPRIWHAEVRSVLDMADCDYCRA